MDIPALTTAANYASHTLPSLPTIIKYLIDVPVEVFSNAAKVINLLRSNVD